MEATRDISYNPGAGRRLRAPETSPRPSVGAVACDGQRARLLLRLVDARVESTGEVSRAAIHELIWACCTFFRPVVVIPAGG